MTTPLRSLDNSVNRFRKIASFPVDLFSSVSRMVTGMRHICGSAMSYAPVAQRVDLLGASVDEGVS